MRCELDLADGERMHVLGRPELFAAKGEFRLRALSLERFGLGAHLAAIERLKQALAAEGLFDAARKRSLPRFPRRIGLVTGSDAAARRDVVTTIQTRFPPRADARCGDAGAGAARRRRASSRRSRSIGREPGIDVVDPDARRRQLRRPAAVQRRARRSRRGGVPGPGRVGGRARAGHAALRPRRGRARVDADGGRQARRAGPRSAAGRARPRTQLARARRAPHDRARAGGPDPRPRRLSSAARAERSSATRSGSRSSATGCGAGPALLVERRRSTLERSGRAARGALAAGDARAGATRSCAGGDVVVRHTDGLSAGRARGGRAGPRRASTPASRRCARVTRVDVREGAAGAGADRRAAGARRRRASTRRSSSGSAARSCCASASPGSRPPRGRSRSSRSAREMRHRFRPATEVRIAPWPARQPRRSPTSRCSPGWRSATSCASRTPSRSGSTPPATRSRARARAAPASS